MSHIKRGTIRLGSTGVLYSVRFSQIYMSLLLRVGGVPGWKTRRKEGCKPCRKCETLVRKRRSPAPVITVIHLIGRQKRMLRLGGAAWESREKQQSQSLNLSISTSKRVMRQTFLLFFIIDGSMPIDNFRNRFTGPYQTSVYNVTAR
jgi:hypothetical protein